MDSGGASLGGIEKSKHRISLSDGRHDLREKLEDCRDSSHRIAYLVFTFQVGQPLTLQENRFAIAIARDHSKRCEETNE